jgi:hypothetical protein
MGSGCRGNLSIEGGSLGYFIGLDLFGSGNSGKSLLGEWVNAVNVLGRG